MNDLVEDKIINMGKHLLKTHKLKLAVNDSNKINLSETNGKMDLALMNVRVNTHCVNLKVPENPKEIHVRKIPYKAFYFKKEKKLNDS